MQKGDRKIERTGETISLINWLSFKQKRKHHQPDAELKHSGEKNFKVKVKISVSSDDEETLKYPYLQIKIEIRNRNRTAIPLIKGIHHPDIGKALSNTSTQSV